ncbi:MAG: glycosyltransferase [Anaerolineales bacterium]|nr:glycosyltransferase [Anaerolineales bacterium]
MSTAVLDLDLNNLPLEIANQREYDRALVLLRLDGRPVGQALVSLSGGRIDGDDLRKVLLLNADSAFWENWLHDYLALPAAACQAGDSPKATVAVCTRDRPEDLERCLNALMQLPDDGQEFIVVDNHPSTDLTRQLVEKYPQVRYVRENRPGLNIARNSALREAANDIVVFTDDDAAPDPNWLRALLRNFDDPRTLCVTGLTMPLELETEAQEWFQRLGGFGRGFKRMCLDNNNCDPLMGWVAGAGVNMALRKSAVELIGPFNDAFDVGTPTRGGGDTDLFIRILSAGYRIIYEPEALNWHRHRRTWPELRRQLFGYEVAGFAIWTCYLFNGNWDAARQMVEWIWREVPTLAKSLLRRPNCTPLDIMAARFCGAALGPWAYPYSLWSVHKGNK